MLPTWPSNVLARWVALLLDMLMGTRKDFPKFTWSSVELEKDLRRPLRWNKVLASLGRIRRVSSIY
jgi:hypothetical protein